MSGATPQLKVESGLTEAEIATVYAGLQATDPAPRRHQQITISLRTPDGKVVGALFAATVWTWLAIDVLWVEPSLRGRGFGTTMVHQAEQIARERGCTHARLDTFAFQARTFYERLGYQVYSQLDDFPDGHAQFHLSKALAPAS